MLDYFQPTWYWIENPWLSKMRDYITDLPYVCVDYCQYSDWGYRKRTRLWTNIPLAPRMCDGRCAAMEGKRHKVNLIDRGGYLHEKYRVPRQLIEELLASAVSAPTAGAPAGAPAEKGEGARHSPFLPLAAAGGGAPRCAGEQTS